jgi:hypothetical protein
VGARWTAADHQARQRIVAEQERPIVDRLRAAGLDVGSLDDLVEPYDAAIPIILDELESGEVRHPLLRITLAALLGVTAVRPYWSRLVTLYTQTSSTFLKDQLAATIGRAAGPRQLDDVIALAQDRRQGGSRVMLIGAIRRSRRQDKGEVLGSLWQDPALRTEIEATVKGFRPAGR